MTETAFVFEPSRFGVYEDPSFKWLSYFADYGSYQYGDEHAHDEMVSFDHRIRYDQMAEELSVSLFINDQYAPYLFDAVEQTDKSGKMEV